MKRIILAVMVCLLLTACAGVVEMTEYRNTLRKLNPVRTNEDLVLFREKSDKKYMSRYGATTHDDTWEFYVVDEYAENGTIFYSAYNFKTAWNPLDVFGRGYTPESQVHGVYIYNPRVNLFVRVPGDNKKAYGYRRTVSGKNIYDRLQFYAPVGKTKRFLQLLSMNQTELRGYFKFAVRMLGYRDTLNSRPIDDKPIVNEMNAYFSEHKDKACSISAKLKAADPNNISTADGFTEKYCVIGARVLQEMFKDLKERRGGYQQAYNGIDPLLNSPDKNLGYEKINIAETMPEVMKKLPVSYESKLGKRGGIAVHDGPEELWLTDTVSNFLSAFTKL